MHGTGLLLGVAVRTAIVLVASFAGFRLIGRRRIGEGRLHDILLVLLLANGVQNAMTTGSGSLWVALVSSGTLLTGAWAFGKASARSAKVERAIGGSPTLLVHDGKVIRQNLRRERVTIDEVMASVRKQGLAAMSDVKLGVLEPNGSISIVRRQAE